MHISSQLLDRVARIRRAIFGLGLLAAIAVGGLFFFCTQVILDSKREAEHEADQAATNVAEAIKHGTARIFELYDLSLQGVITRLKDPGIARLSGTTRQLALFDFAANAANLNMVSVIDETGRFVDNSRGLSVPELDFADRDYFEVHRDNPDMGMFVSGPMKSRIKDGEWIIAISRRISRPDGSFAGVVVGTIQLAYFRSLLSNLFVGPGGTISLLRTDGTLIADNPFELVKIGQDFGKLTLFQHLSSATAGQFESVGVTDGIPRRITYEQIDNLPLVVTVGFAIADIYAPLRQKAFVVGGLLLGLSLAIVALIMLLSREFLRRKAAYAWLKDAFEAIPIGLVLCDAQDRFVLWNKHYVEQRMNDKIKVGMRYEESLRDCVSQGLIADAIGCEEEWLNKRLDRHNAPDTDYVQSRQGNRWTRIKETRTSDGGRIGVRIDVTDLKRSEESFRLLLEKNPLPMWVFDHASLRFLAVNDAAVEHYGYGKDTFLAMTILDIRPDEERQKVREVVGTGKDTGEAGHFWRHRKADGTEIEVAIFAKHLTFQGHSASVVAAIDVTEQRQAERRLAHYARHDPLTNLANHRAFSEHIRTVLADMEVVSEPFPVLCLDIDRFKEINDEFGHAAGDELLCEVAHRLKSAVGGAFVARVGGDEFAIVATSERSSTLAGQIADRIHSAMAEDFVIQGRPRRLGVSIGVAIFPTDGLDEQTLMRNADAARYRAKSNGRGVTHFFQPEMDLQLRERHAMQHDLDAAIARNELLLHYQPQARIGGGIFGFEALVRWKRRQHGLVSPDVFVPLAEETGLILQIGEWVLREACREAASWPNPLTVAVNLSPIQFRHNDLVGLVHAILLETGLAPHRLELEITEGVMLDDQSRALSILRRMKGLGVRIAMDDFGCGYSSLSYLQSFPFDKIKIDRSFVINIGRKAQAAAIIRAVIGLGRGLQMPIIAEGVETEDQLAFLVNESCDEIQGHLLGRPRPIFDYADVVGSPMAAASAVCNA